jgi:hypothetical protein
VFQNLSLELIQHVLTKHQKTGQKLALQDKFGLEVVQYQFKQDQFLQTMHGKACQATLASFTCAFFLGVCIFLDGVESSFVGVRLSSLLLCEFRMGDCLCLLEEGNCILNISIS